jgi:hypothetical protein
MKVHVMTSSKTDFSSSCSSFCPNTINALPITMTNSNNTKIPDDHSTVITQQIVQSQSITQQQQLQLYPTEPPQQQVEDIHNQQQIHDGVEEQRRVSFQTDDKLETIYIIRREIEEMDTSESSLSSFTRRRFFGRMEHHLNEEEDDDDDDRSFEFADDDDEGDDEYCSDSDNESVEDYYSCMEDDEDDDYNQLNMVQENDDHSLNILVESTTTADDFNINTTLESNSSDDESLHSITNNSTDGGNNIVDLSIDDVADVDDIDDSDDDDDNSFDSDHFVTPRPMKNYSMESNTATVAVATTTLSPVALLSNQETASEFSRKRRLNLTISSSRIRDELDDVSHRRGSSHQRFYS